MSFYLRTLLGFSCILSFASVGLAQTSSVLPNGVYTVTPSYAPEMRLDAVGAGLGNTTVVDISQRLGIASQAWIFSSLGGGYYRIEAAYSKNLCLDVSNAGVLDGTSVDLYQDNSTKAQRWLVQPVGGGAYTLAPECAASSRLDCDRRDPGTKVQIWESMPIHNERWIIAPMQLTEESAYNGTFSLIPGTIQIEDYDKGGESTAYHSAFSTNQGGQYRTEGVGIESCADAGAGYDVSWTGPWQWMRYTVFVATPGAHTVTFRVAAGSGGGGTFHLQNSLGATLTGPVKVPVTGGWQTWASVTASVTLPAGKQVLTLYEDSGGYNLNWMSFS